MLTEEEKNQARLEYQKKRAFEKKLAFAEDRIQQIYLRGVDNQPPQVRLAEIAKHLRIILAEIDREQT